MSNGDHDQSLWKVDYFVLNCIGWNCCEESMSIQCSRPLASLVSKQYRRYRLFLCSIMNFIIYLSMLSLLILLISQSVIRCSGSPQCGFLNPYITPLWNWWRSTQCFSQYTMHEVLWRHSYRTVQNLYKALYLFQNEAYNSYS